MKSLVGSNGWKGVAVIGTGKRVLTPLTDAEALTVVKGGVSLYNSPDSPLKGVPEHYEQPTEVQDTYDTFKAICEAAHPNETKQDAFARAAQRKVFNERMGNFIDLVLLGSQKVPSLVSRFSFDVLTQNKPRTTTNRNAVPYLVLQAIDKDPGTVRCKVRGGVKKGIEIQHAYDDPSNEANWQHNDAYVNANFSMPGLISGRRTYVRGRYIFSKGKKGPWSEMVSIMVP